LKKKPPENGDPELRNGVTALEIVFACGPKKKTNMATHETNGGYTRRKEKGMKEKKDGTPRKNSMSDGFQSRIQARAISLGARVQTGNGPENNTQSYRSREQ